MNLFKFWSVEILPALSRDIFNHAFLRTSVTPHISLTQYSTVVTISMIMCVYLTSFTGNYVSEIRRPLTMPLKLAAGPRVNQLCPFSAISMILFDLTRWNLRILCLGQVAAFAGNNYLLIVLMEFSEPRHARPLDLLISHSYSLNSIHLRAHKIKHLQVCLKTTTDHGPSRAGIPFFICTARIHPLCVSDQRPQEFMRLWGSRRSSSFIVERSKLCKLQSVRTNSCFRKRILASCKQEREAASLFFQKLEARMLSVHTRLRINQLQRKWTCSQGLSVTVLAPRAR